MLLLLVILINVCICFKFSISVEARFQTRFVFFHYSQHLLKLTLVHRHLADQTLNVVKITILQFARVFLASLAHHHLVDLNVSQAVNVHSIKLVPIRNVLTLVQELVEFKLNVKSSTTIQSVVVKQATLEIHLLDVNLKLCMTIHNLHQILVNHLHAVQTRNVESLMNKLHVHAYLK
jgi:hypothetical protein